MRSRRGWIFVLPLIAVVGIAVYGSQSNERTTYRICQTKVPIGQSADASC